MVIGLGSDHGGFPLKEEIKTFLNEQGYVVKDYGCFNTDSVDYPDIAKDVCSHLLMGECEAAILFCGTGIGISIAANKVRGIRAALCSDTYSARMAREHNNANVIALGARVIGVETAREIVMAYLNAAFAGGRHQGRVDKIEESSSANG